MRKGRVIRACCVTACAHACTRHVPGSYANEIIHPTAIAIKQSLSARRNPRRLRINPGEVKHGYGYNSLSVVQRRKGTRWLVWPAVKHRASGETQRCACVNEQTSSLPRLATSALRAVHEAFGTKLVQVGMGYAACLLAPPWFSPLDNCLPFWPQGACVCRQCLSDMFVLKTVVFMV